MFLNCDAKVGVIFLLTKFFKKNFQKICGGGGGKGVIGGIGTIVGIGGIGIIGGKELNLRYDRCKGS